jgi:hypothetical protein
MKEQITKLIDSWLQLHLEVMQHADKQYGFKPSNFVRISDLKLQSPQLAKEILEVVGKRVIEIVTIGNIDPDFEYKKEYYKGHNELKEYLISSLTSNLTDNK